MRRYILSLAAVALAGAFGAEASDFPFESCSYSIQADCAFIHDTAAHATVQCSCYGGNFSATLGGSSVPIFDTIFCVNDTVQATFSPSGRASVPATENVQYMNGYYRKPHPGRYSDPDSPNSYRNIWGGGYLSADNSTMEAVSLTADMLCMFYYAKTVDFAAMPVGVPQNIPVMMPGGAQRTLQLTYDGVCDFYGSQAYKLTANFTYEGSFSNYPISIIVDPNIGVPVQFAANIDIGRVVMTYEY